MTTDPIEQLKQTDIRRFFDTHGTGAWTVVYRSWHEPDRNGAFFAAFAPKKYRPTALESPSWDLSIGGGMPGFSQFYRAGRPRTTYLRFGNDDGLEPIVVIQEHHGMKERQPQISEEFRLYHNLWIEPRSGNLIKVEDDGSESVAAEISSNEVKIRTSLLRKFQAARQLDLLLFLDSVRFVDGVDSGTDLDALTEEVETDWSRSSFHAGVLTLGDRPFSRLLAKKIIAPPPRKMAGIWPYDKRKESYPEFILGEDESGNPVRFTCEPDRLANYFGANPDAPHYLTPVFFRREVLRRYYDEPEKYSVEDGYLRCGGLWGLRLDNDHPDHVMVFLGDLGRDLPEAERDYWHAFNVPPAGSMSTTAFRRAILGQFADATARDIEFKALYERLRRDWRAAKGWDLWRDLEPADSHVFQQLHIPLTESQPEFEGQILGLTKLLVDSLNESKLTELLGRSLKDEKGIGKLERWLKKEGYPHADRDIAYLRKLQRLRSRMAAHRKGSDYDKFLAAELGDVPHSEAVADLMSQGSRMIEGLTSHFIASAGT